jgi:serine/threonine protein kinase
MKSLLASVRAGSGLDRADHAVQMLEEEWRRNGDAPLERLWTEQKHVVAVDRDESEVVLAEMIKTDLRCRFARGQTPTVGEYLDRFPELQDAGSRVLSLIYEEFCLVEERGDTVDVESFCERYPRWKDSLRSQLQYHRMFSQAAGLCPQVPKLPEAGEKFEEFDLISLLGKGGTSRVFLARDLSLGGKQVVVKVSLDAGQEPQAQGPLDHPHIVPVNSVVFDGQKLRGLSMPYRPGLPLDEIIKRVSPASRPRHAIALWDAMVAGLAVRPVSAAASSPEAGATKERTRPLPRGDGWEGFPTRGTYAQGAAWVAMVLARALAHAHAMKTFHRDVKPGNVLLTLHHGPQLLDFNLAESPHSALRAEAAMHGGTPPYMAPEQMEAFFDPELWGTVGAKADVYSLGLVLRELLTGEPPEVPPQPMSICRAMRALLDRRPLLDVSVRLTNPAIPHALEAIVGRCLKLSPEDRYADAQSLADDLERFVKREPLRHTTNPSRVEAIHNRLARNGRTLTASAGWLILLGTLLYPTVKLWVDPVEARAVFRDAVNKFDEAGTLPTQGSLENLVKEDPKAAVPRFYLAFVRDAQNSREDAERIFQEALSIPGAQRTLISWGRSHVLRGRPAVGAHLEKFADIRRVRAEEMVTREHISDDDTKARIKQIYTHGISALALAAELGRLSSRSEYNLTLFEEYAGHHESALARLSRYIEAAEPSPDEDFTTLLYQHCIARSRVSTHLAEGLRAQGSLAANKRALELMQQAKKDLQYCDSYLVSHDSTPLQAYFVVGVKLPAMLTLGEIEVDLSLLAQAQKHLAQSKSLFQPFRELARATAQTPTPAKLKQWNQRLIEALNRLSAQRELDHARADRPESHSGAS